MKRFADLDQYLAGDEPGLELTIAGRVYTVPPPDAETGLWCERLAAVAPQVQQATTDADVQAAVERVEALPKLPGDLTFPQRVLSAATHAAMVSDGVDHVRVRIAAMTAFVWIISGDEAAERVWTSGGRPEALAPGNRGERRSSTTTAEAGTTRQPGSGSGTSRQTTSGRGRARRSRGRRS